MHWLWTATPLSILPRNKLNAGPGPAFGLQVLPPRYELSLDDVAIVGNRTFLLSGRLSFLINGAGASKRQPTPRNREHRLAIHRGDPFRSSSRRVFSTDPGHGPTTDLDASIDPIRGAIVGPGPCPTTGLGSSTDPGATTGVGPSSDLGATTGVGPSTDPSSSPTTGLGPSIDVDLGVTTGPNPISDLGSGLSPSTNLGPRIDPGPGTSTDPGRGPTTDVGPDLTIGPGPNSESRARAWLLGEISERRIASLGKEIFRQEAGELQLDSGSKSPKNHSWRGETNPISVSSLIS
ncbi:hypothetical protein VNO77_03511 [Canavalia gladiata]|uniref:Uncharacterized protein n=1 Tax=Canavalia gladiata TaxID=3824 RepID=A0AAN9R6X3_CANGL